MNQVDLPRNTPFLRGLPVPLQHALLFEMARRPKLTWDEVDFICAEFRSESLQGDPKVAG
jgi:hypothetical protein